MSDKREQQRRGAIAEALRDSAYVCNRVWEAWSFGTMTVDDFHPAWEDDELIDSILEAAVGASEAAGSARTPLEVATGESHQIRSTAWLLLRGYVDEAGRDGQPLSAAEMLTLMNGLERSWMKPVTAAIKTVLASERNQQ